MSPKLKMVVVKSEIDSTKVSLRVITSDGRLSGSDMKRQLTEAGFKVGDIVLLTKLNARK